LNQPSEFTAVYESTILTTWDPATPHSPRSPEQVAVELGMPAVVMTAWNPGHERPEKHVNEAANNALLQQLVTFPYPVWPCDGRNLDGTFVEPGFCIWGMPVEQGCVIARQYGQYAIFAITSDGHRSLIWL